MTTQARMKPKMAFTETVGVGGVRENRLVAGANDDTVVEAGAGSTRVVGVSKYTQAAGTQSTIENHQELEVVYAAAANKGERLVAAANGEVTPAGATPDARTLVGSCSKSIAAPGIGLANIRCL